MTKVAIVRGTTPPDMTVKALQMVSADEVLSKEKPILIKPNYINARHPSTGITTDSRVIEGVAKFLRQHDMKEVIIGEGSGFADTLEAFRVAGVDAVAERWNVKIVDLNKDDFIEVIPKNENKQKVQFYDLWKNACVNLIVLSIDLRAHYYQSDKLFREMCARYTE